jgi:predicted PurR-regulated permease PerM
MNNLISEKPVELGKLIEVAYLVVILSAFAWAKEFLLPLMLAILISFLLAPVVSRLERWGFPRVVAVLSVVAIAFALIGGLCSTLSLQGLDVVNSLPKYHDNIHARWVAIQQGPPGPLNLAFSNVGAAIADLGKVTASAEGAQQPEATKVQIVSGADSVVAIVKNSLTPVMGPIAEFAVVVVLVVFMLLERKQIRVRFLRLMGHSRVATTTLAIDEAGCRLSGFLLGQLLVNTGYALVLGIGLSLIGILALGGSDPRIAVFALRGSLDIGLFPVGSIYCDLFELERADIDSGPLRISGSVHEQRCGTFCLRR